MSGTNYTREAEVQTLNEMAAEREAAIQYRGRLGQDYIVIDMNPITPALYTAGKRLPEKL